MLAKLAANLYELSPVFLQNLAVSMKGRSYVRKRYGGEYRSHVNELMRTQWFSAEQFRELQVRELRSLVGEAAEQVPHYREAMRDFAARRDSLTLADLKDMPMLDKELLRLQPDRCINKSRLRFGYDEGHTSGTSGIPLVWLYDLRSIRRDLAFRERQYRWAGLTGRERSGRFSGRLLLGTHSGPPYWRHNSAESQWLFSTYHITDETLPLYYEMLKTINFAYLDGYPSALFSIAQWINEQQLTRQWTPWAVITTAETLMPFQREQISKAFGCAVFNFYSSSEGAPFVTQCPAGRLHLNPESGIIEFLRPDGAAAEPGEDAEMVVTSFFQRTMPLIRYRIGDTGALSGEQSCPCGRQMPVVKHIGGREDDVLISSERGRIGSAALSTALYKVPFSLKESQIEQVDDDSFVFRYIPMHGELMEDQIGIIRRQMHERLGRSVTIKVERVREIPKGPSGKSQLVIGLKRSRRMRGTK